MIGWPIITVLFIYFTALFFLAQRLHNNSIVDLAWGIGFVIVAVTGYLLMPEIVLPFSQTKYRQTGGLSLCQYAKTLGQTFCQIESLFECFCFAGSSAVYRCVADFLCDYWFGRSFPLVELARCHRVANRLCL